MMGAFISRPRCVIFCCILTEGCKTQLGRLYTLIMVDPDIGSAVRSMIDRLLLLSASVHIFLLILYA